MMDEEPEPFDRSDPSTWQVAGDKAPGQRKIGGWLVMWGVMEGYREEWGEDGPYTSHFNYLLVQAVSERGRMYVCMRTPTTLEACREYCEKLHADFSPEDCDDWSFERNVYGSEAYQANWHEEEYSRMDEGERRLAGY